MELQAHQELHQEHLELLVLVVYQVHQEHQEQVVLQELKVLLVKILMNNVYFLIG